MMRSYVEYLKSHPRMAIVLVVVLTTLAYCNIFTNEFLVDDQLFITDWPLIQSLNNFPQFFGKFNQPKGEEGVYSPLKTLFHALNYALWGKNPFGHHAVSLLIHLAGTVCVYGICLLLAGSTIVAFLAALFFGLHPVHVEAITFLTASVDSLGVVFVFLSFYFYLRFSHSQFKEKAQYIASMIFASLAIFTHELAISLPFFIVLYEWCFKADKFRSERLWRRSIPYFIIAVIYVLLKIYVLGGAARGGYLYGSIYLTLLTVSKALLRYLQVLFFPAYLSLNPELSSGIFSVDWKHFDKFAVLSQSIFEIPVLISAFLNGFLIHSAMKMRRQNPLISFCILWYFLSLLPVSNIIPTESYFAERYLYPGSLSFCLLAAMGIQWAYNKPKLKIWAVIVFFCMMNFYFARTFLRNLDWNNEKAFLEAEASMNPHHPVMRRDLGIVYLREGQPKAALEHLQFAVAKAPQDADSFFALAEAQGALEDYSNAIINYQKAIAINPKFAESYYNLAGIYAYQGDEKRADQLLEVFAELFRQQGKSKEAQEWKEAFDKYFKKKN